MRKLIITLLLCFMCSPAQAIIHGTVDFVGDGGAAADYSDIIAYHNADALGNLVKAGGVATVTYDGGILLETSAPIVGTGSWDNNNDGYDNLLFAISGNIDFPSGRIGFYHKPIENNDGHLAWTDGSDFKVEAVSTNGFYNVTFLGDGNGDTTAFSAGTTYFLEFEFNGTSCEFFVDGVSQFTVTGSGSVDDTSMNFFSADGNAWDSFVDQFISSNDPDRDLNAVKTVTDFS